MSIAGGRQTVVSPFRPAQARIQTSALCLNNFSSFLFILGFFLHCMWAEHGETPWSSTGIKHSTSWHSSERFKDFQGESAWWPAADLPIWQHNLMKLVSRFPSQLEACTDAASWLFSTWLRKIGQTLKNIKRWTQLTKQLASVGFVDPMYQTKAVQLGDASGASRS